MDILKIQEVKEKLIALKDCSGPSKYRAIPLQMTLFDSLLVELPISIRSYAHS